MNLKPSLILALLSLIVSPWANAQESKPAAATYEERRAQEVTAMFQSQKTPQKTFSFWAGYSHLWLNEDLELGNQLIRKAYDEALQGRKGKRVRDPDPFLS